MPICHDCKQNFPILRCPRCYNIYFHNEQNEEIKRLNQEILTLKNEIIELLKK